MKENTLLKKVVSLLMTVILVFGTVNMAFAAETVQYSPESDFTYWVETLEEAMGHYDAGTEIAVIESYTGDDKKVIIPETIDGYPVGAIGYFSFSGFDGDLEFDTDSKVNNIESVVIPDSVVGISAGAFLRLGTTNTLTNQLFSNLYGGDTGNSEIEITVPSSVVYIGPAAFGCITIVEINNSAVKETPQQTVYYEGTAEKWDSICDKEDIGDNLRTEIKNEHAGSLNISFVIDFDANLKFTYICTCDGICDNETERKDPTCTETGYIKYTCDCGVKTSKSFIPVFNHSDTDSDSICDYCSKEILEENGYKYTVENGEATINSYTGEGGHVIIPDILGDYPVVKIAPYAFCTADIFGGSETSASKNIESIVIPNSVKCIGEGAFLRLGIGSLLEALSIIGDLDIKEYLGKNEITVTVPAGVEYIGPVAFGCLFMDLKDKKSENLPEQTVFFEGSQAQWNAICKNDTPSLDFDAEFDINEDITVVTYFIGSTKLHFSCDGVCDNEAERKVPTCTETGYIKYTCDCGTETSETVLKPEHSDNDSNGICDICNENALIEEEDYLYTVYQGKATIKGYNGDGGKLIIPSTLGGYPVVAIGSYAFIEKQKIEEITIPEGVTVIGDYAFEKCLNLDTVYFPETLTEIRESAFSGCILLDDIILPKGLTNIYAHAFYRCESLSSIFIPEKIITVEYGTFEYCCNLEDVTLPNGLRQIDHSAFRNCTSLESIEIPETVTSIGDYAFADCTELESFIIPEGVQKISCGLFSDCSSLTSVEIPETVTSIDDSAFLRSGIKEISLPDSITNIGDNAFSSTYLKTVELPESLTTLGSDAFFGCKSLESISLPNTLKTIGNYAFAYCSALKEISLPESIESIGSYAFYGCVLEEIELPEGIEKIADHTFEHSSIKSIIIPSTVTKIQIAAFLDCPQLTNAHFSGTQEQWDAVSVKGDNETLTDIIHIATDENSDGICDICYPESEEETTEEVTTEEVTTEEITTEEITTEEVTTEEVTTEEVTTEEVTTKEATTEEITTEEVTTEEKTTEEKTTEEVTTKEATTEEITTQAEETTIEDVTTAPEEEKIQCGDNVYWSINNAGRLIISGEGNMWTYYPGLNSRTDIKSVVIEEGVTSVSDYAFYNNIHLTSVELPDSMSKIGVGAFYNCVNLESIIIPKGVTEIEEGVFKACSDLRTVTIPESVTIVWSTAFLGCESLTDVYYDGSQKNWNAIEVQSQNEALLNASIHFAKADTDEPSVEETTIAPPTTDTSTTEDTTIPAETTFSTTEDDTTTQEPSTIRPTTTSPSTTKKDESTTTVPTTTEAPSSTVATSTTESASAEKEETSTKLTTTEKRESTTVAPATTKTPNSTTPPSTTKAPTTSVVTEEEEPVVKAMKPARVKIKKPKSVKKGTVVVSWKVMKNVNGYQLSYSMSKKFKKKVTKSKLIKKAKTTKTTLKKLKSGKKYFIRLRAYKTVNGKKIYGTWSKVVNVKVK